VVGHTTKECTFFIPQQHPSGFQQEERKQQQQGQLLRQKQPHHQLQPQEQTQLHRR
jgi:hypothetical protein